MLDEVKLAPERARDPLDVDFELGFGRCPGDRVENAIVGPDPVTAQVECPGGYVIKLFYPHH